MEIVVAVIQVDWMWELVLGIPINLIIRISTRNRIVWPALQTLNKMQAIIISHTIKKIHHHLILLVWGKVSLRSLLLMWEMVVLGILAIPAPNNPNCSRRILSTSRTTDWTVVAVLRAISEPPISKTPIIILQVLKKNNQRQEEITAMLVEMAAIHYFLPNGNSLCIKVWIMAYNSKILKIMPQLIITPSQILKWELLHRTQSIDYWKILIRAATWIAIIP